jgi:hypothetical protein
MNTSTSWCSRHRSENILGVERTAFVSNKIPSPRIDPIAIALLAQIPLPNLPGTAQNLRATEKQKIEWISIAAGVSAFIVALGKTGRCESLECGRA